MHSIPASSSKAPAPLDVAAPLLAARDLRVHFFTQSGVVHAVDGVDFAVGGQETLGLVGESGSGKTVSSLALLRLVPRPARIVAGEIDFEGENLLAKSGAQLRRTPPGRENDYHTASRRQYVITLSGHAELVLSGGQTIQVGPGSIELAEDLTGKGHITRTVGTEDRVVILIPVSGP